MSEDEAQDKAAAAAKKKETFEEAQRRKKEEKARQSAASKAAKDAPDQPSADKLFCEEIDVGEATGPREIASGLRDYYSLEEMQDRLVLVVCNLKAAKIVDFMSNGMVLAAKSEDGKAELITPPEGSSIGERVFIEGLEGEPYTSSQTKKKKTWTTVAVDLKTDDKGIATWQGKTIQTSAGPCQAASLANAPIS